MLLLGTGRIMGASGIVGGLIEGTDSHWLPTLAFLIGLIGAPALMALAGWRVETLATQNVVLLVLGGLAVGVGTRLADGCTSGHGVCGMSRLSVRGIVATLVYIAAGALTVTAMRVGLGL